MKNFAFVIAGCAALLLVVSFGIIPSSNNKVATCNCIAFRLDDIQDYFLNSVQIAIMDLFDRHNLSLTVGVIGNYFGEDAKIVNYVKGRVDDPLFEVANHGWNHEDFAVFDKEQQSELMKKSNEKIFDLLGTKPDVFIAPYNIINGDTIAAAQENGMRYLSANVTYDSPPYDIDKQSFYHFPQTALMGDLNDDDTVWLTFTHDKVFAEIEDSMQRYGFAVVTIHPQDFAVRDMLDYQNAIDYDHLKKLELLLDKIQDEEIRIVTLSEINRHALQEQDIYMQAWQRGKEEEIIGG